MANVPVEIPSPLRECFTHCEVECVSACCGIHAFSTDPDLVDAWCRRVGPDAVVEARLQLAELIALVEDRSHSVTLTLLNAWTPDNDARRGVLAFLAKFDAGLAAGDV